MYRIKIDRSRCIGCLTCVTACVDHRQRYETGADLLPALRAAGVRLHLHDGGDEEESGHRLCGV